MSAKRILSIVGICLLADFRLADFSTQSNKERSNVRTNDNKDINDLKDLKEILHESLMSLGSFVIKLREFIFG